MNSKRTYTLYQATSSIFLMLALLWLTISVPFVYAGQQQIADSEKLSQPAHEKDHQSDEQSCNPFGNTTEEKAPSSGVNTLSEEYIHHSDDYFHTVELFLSHHHIHSVDEYISYHGELLTPPPNAVI